MTALWTSEEIVAATGGVLHGAAFAVSGVTFDSRDVGPGDLFVAMPGTTADGHDFVAKAFVSGAAAALVSRAADGPHILVTDVAQALTDLAIAARARMSDIVIVTDDNPRNENPALIRTAMLAGAPGATEIGDRREAIAAAIAMARAGDIVLVAGKGHEQGQIVGDRVLPFDDVAVARECAA